MELINNFPQWIKTKRQEAGLSQDALADISHISRVTIIAAESTGTKSTFETQSQLAKALGYKLSLAVKYIEGIK